jgi:Nitrile hydratase, alpha chain
MTQAGGAGAISRAEFERRLINRSLEDETFRQRLLDEPKAAVEQELGSGLPESIEVRVVQESQDTIYLVLPSRAAVAQGTELSDQDLEKVSGGSTFSAIPDDEESASSGQVYAVC